MNLPTRQSDPSGFWGSITATIGALLALLVAFGVPLTDDQTVAILGLGTALGPIVTQWLIRKDAWSPVAHHKDVAQASAMTPCGESGDIDLSAIAWLLAVLILLVVLVRLL